MFFKSIVLQYLAESVDGTLVNRIHDPHQSSHSVDNDSYCFILLLGRSLPKSR
jgi:hypothetical protein